MSIPGKRPECPLGGDNEHCETCAYSPDYEWSDKFEECLSRPKTKEQKT